jgi:hypothetical protein
VTSLEEIGEFLSQARIDDEVKRAIILKLIECRTTQSDLDFEYAYQKIKEFIKYKESILN